MNLTRIKENKFYILYKRSIPNIRKDITPLYTIYRTSEFGGDQLKDVRTRREAISIFNKATKEAIQYEREVIK